MSLFAVDGVRLSDISVLGWAAIAAAGCLALWTTGSGINVLLTGNGVGEFVIGGVLTVVLLGFAHSEAAPEVEAACANCGDSVRSQANRDGVDEVVEVSASGSPRRASIGRISFVVHTTTNEWLYCSGECATDDRDRRTLIAQPDGRQLVSSADQSVTQSTPQRAATDGGQAQTDDQGTLRPATEYSDS
mgnify:CR=1 FL=1